MQLSKYRPSGLLTQKHTVLLKSPSHMLTFLVAYSKIHYSLDQEIRFDMNEGEPNAFIKEYETPNRMCFNKSERVCIRQEDLDKVIHQASTTCTTGPDNIPQSTKQTNSAPAPLLESRPRSGRSLSPCPLKSGGNHQEAYLLTGQSA